MNKHNLRKWMLPLCLLMASALIPTGCDDPDTSDLDGYFESHPFVNDPRTTSQVVKIDPSSVTISTIGRRILFRASGGSGGYTWNVYPDSMGSFTPSGDSQAVYVSAAIGDYQIIVYDRNGDAAICTISSSQIPMTIKADPDSTLENDKDICILTVTGGTAPYTWRCPDTQNGNVTENTGSSVPYRRDRAGDNYVTVTDVTGESRSIVIIQPPL